MMPGGPVQGDVNTTLPLVLNIVGIVCCACFPVAIVGLVFSIQANTAKKAGDIATAQNKAKIALICGIVSLALGVLGWMGGGISGMMN